SGHEAAGAEPPKGRAAAEEEGTREGERGREDEQRPRGERGRSRLRSGGVAREVRHGRTVAQGAVIVEARRRRSAVSAVREARKAATGVTTSRRRERTRGVSRARARCLRAGT